MVNGTETEVPFVPNYYPDVLAGYAYEADIHCIECSVERFGQDLQIRVAGGHQTRYPYGKREADPPRDNEGNFVTAFDGSEEFQCSAFCGDCGKDLGPEVTIVHRIPKGKRTCHYCGMNKKDMGENVYISELI